MRITVEEVEWVLAHGAGRHTRAAVEQRISWRLLIGRASW
jgi:hypothetical protein